MLSGTITIKAVTDAGRPSGCTAATVALRGSGRGWQDELADL